MVEIFNDIRKVHQFAAPCDELAAHIEFFSESMPPAENLFRNNLTPEFKSVKMFPSYTPTFWINLGTPYVLLVADKTHLIRADDDILVLRDTSVEKFKQPTDHIFTVKFLPGGLEAVLGINQAILIGQVIDLNTILPPPLLKKIKHPLCFEERLELMQSFLLGCYKGSHSDHYLQFVTDCIGNYDAAGMQINTSQMAEKMFVTSKTINRYFNKVVGTSPKNYFSIMRTRVALTAYINQKEIFTPYDFGYYDMSHFYKDVVKFTGQKLTYNIV
ncbi:helix-turn-helix domain-containing protein [Mucilaginibacter flavidus]|uniref:helix-turn-helix domain-containing protein n=1 Tax=Mucilaginibacter flavidus TaxID=2949309 RepID=UPI002092B278|nr:helix-turn-helix domain-containing protein [Mucilaginibacter flavidus]MCO5946463.1 helix-turn-helix domain-containing protein [Mucilaginibacter flavidus]